MTVELLATGVENLCAHKVPHARSGRELAHGGSWLRAGVGARSKQEQSIGSVHGAVKYKYPH